MSKTKKKTMVLSITIKKRHQLKHLHRPAVNEHRVTQLHPTPHRPLRARPGSSAHHHRHRHRAAPAAAVVVVATAPTIGGTRSDPQLDHDLPNVWRLDGARLILIYFNLRSRRVYDILLFSCIGKKLCLFIFLSLRLQRFPHDL